MQLGCFNIAACFNISAITMDKFIPNIKKKYQEKLINREKQWPPCHLDKLVRLELVERRKGEVHSANLRRGQKDDSVKRTPLAYYDLFKVQGRMKPVRKVLVEVTLVLARHVSAHQSLKTGQMGNSSSSLNYFSSFHFVRPK